MTEVIECQKFGDIVTSYTGKIKSGYVLDRVENSPLTITADAEENVIKVYYISAMKDMAIEIPNTGIDSDNSYLELFIGLIYLAGISVFFQKRQNNN